MKLCFQRKRLLLKKIYKKLYKLLVENSTTNNLSALHKHEMPKLEKNHACPILIPQKATKELSNIYG